MHFNATVGVPSPSFYDLHHPVKPGCQVWQSRLSGELVKVLPRQ
jgi:hypothetical protein